MRIALYPNPDRDHHFITTRRLIHLIHTHGGTAVLEPAMAPEIDEMLGMERASFTTCDLMISLGGDGTFISAAHHAIELRLPVTGVNLGSVGFLPEIDIGHLEEAVEIIMNKAFKIEERMILDVTCFNDEGTVFAKNRAINDVVLTRGGVSRIITAELQIDGISVEKIPGDGVIVASPTGSTAYTLSAGGPIVHPTLEMMLITPICPHTLHNRTYVSGPDTTVSLTLMPYPKEATLSVDGWAHYAVRTDYTINVCKSTRSLRFARLWQDVFFETLPQKIQKRGISR